MEQKIHQGRNVKRFREMLGIKQEALAFDLGADWNQKKISMLEQKDIIEAGGEYYFKYFQRPIKWLQLLSYF